MAQANAKELAELCQAIENPDTAAPREQAMARILQLGPATIPWLQRRFDETHHHRYFYLLQKLHAQAAKPPVTATPASPWSKEQYFQKRYEEAAKLFQQREVEKAREIVQAILTLEPNLSLRAELEQLLHDCRDLAEQSLQARLSCATKLVKPGEAIVVTVALHNPLNSAVTLIAGQGGVVIEISLREFTLRGSVQERTLSQIIPLNGEIVLDAGAQWQSQITITNAVPAQNVYGQFRIKAYVPRSQIRYADRATYPQIRFNDLTISALPAHCHGVAANPEATVMAALQLRQLEPLFFAAFFLERPTKARLFPALANALEQEDRLDAVIVAILRRFTGKAFTNKKLWLNYWAANESSWEEILE